MRWGEKKPQMGDDRVVERFLIIPTCIDGKCRWLEWTWIEQTYIGAGRRAYWQDVRWASGAADLQHAHPIHHPPWGRQ